MTTLSRICTSLQRSWHCSKVDWMLCNYTGSPEYSSICLSSFSLIFWKNSWLLIIYKSDLRTLNSLSYWFSTYSSVPSKSHYSSIIMMSASTLGSSTGSFAPSRSPISSWGWYELAFLWGTLKLKELFETLGINSGSLASSKGRCSEIY